VTPLLRSRLRLPDRVFRSAWCAEPAYRRFVAVTFIDRDTEFEQWRDEHPDAFIVNHARVPSAAYVALHRAGCVRLRTSRGSNWTSTYAKTCSETLNDVRTWARRTIGTVDLHRCHFCQPPALRP
jgi:hypothetical protein